MNILFLGETYRADAQTWIKGIEQNAGVKISTLEVKPSKSRIRRLLSLFFFLGRIAKINGTQWDIVLAERSTSYGFFSLFVRAKVRVVAQQGITDAYPVTGLSGVIKRAIKGIVYRNVDWIHAWGHVMVPAMLHAGADPAKIQVLPKGINLELYQDSKSNPSQARKTGIVTRSLFPDYRHEDILRAIELVSKTIPEVRVLIVGDGVLSADLESLALELGISEHVKFLGRVPNNELPQLLAQSDFYISVPISEGVSASLFEAMATRNFPIVSDLPAYKAFIKDGINGSLVPVGNPAALAEAILRFLNSPDKYESAVSKNREYIEASVDFDKNMKAIYQKYITILKNK